MGMGPNVRCVFTKQVDSIHSNIVTEKNGCDFGNTLWGYNIKTTSQ